jgi:hypothetical protein
VAIDLAAVDAASIYAVLAEPASQGPFAYRIFFSPDAGATWASAPPHPAAGNWC